MKTLPLLALAGLLMTAGCNSPSQINNHWSARSIGPRAMRTFTGYEADKDGPYIDYQWEQKSRIYKTARRHFLNWNEDNPFQSENPNWNADRPVNSILPRPHYYLLPDLGFSSALATMEGSQGKEEFVAGVSETFRPTRVYVSSFVHGYVGRRGVVGHVIDTKESRE